MDLTLPQRDEVSVPREIGRGTILDRWRLPDGTLYLDNAATRPMLPEVAEEMARLMANNPLNASSQHKYGQKAARMLEDARNFFKSELNVPSTGELIFNSGATEGLNMLLKSAYFADPTKNHIVTVKTEHKAVLNTCAYLETIGAEVTYLDVDEWGQVSVSDIEAAIRPTTCAVCVMWVNNETGVISPIEQIGLLAESMGVIFICDATQALGKIHVACDMVGVSAIVAGAHKVGGPVGVGLIVVQGDNAHSQSLSQSVVRSLKLCSGTVGVAKIWAFYRALDAFQPASHEDVREALEVLSEHIAFNYLLPPSSMESRLSLITPIVLQDERLLHRDCHYVVWSRGSACLGGLDRASHVYSLMSSAPHFVRRLSF